MIQVDLPALVLEQVVGIPLDTQILANGLTKRESRLGNEDAVADFAHDSHGIVESSGAPEGQEDVVGVDWVRLSAELLSDGLASSWCASRGSVAIVLLRLYSLNDCSVYGLRELEAVGLGWLSKTEVDHGLLVVLGRAQLVLEDLADGVDDVGAGGGAVLHLSPGGVAGV